MSHLLKHKKKNVNGVPMNSSLMEKSYSHRRISIPRKMYLTYVGYKQSDIKNYILMYGHEHGLKTPSSLKSSEYSADNGDYLLENACNYLNRDGQMISPDVSELPFKINESEKYCRTDVAAKSCLLNFICPKLRVKFDNVDQTIASAVKKSYYRKINVELEPFDGTSHYVFVWSPSMDNGKVLLYQFSISYFESSRFYDFPHYGIRCKKIETHSDINSAGEFLSFLTYKLIPIVKG